MKSARIPFFICLVIVLYNCERTGNKLSDQPEKSLPKEIPHLEKQGTATRLVVEGKPFLLISGELHNSICGGLEYMRPVWKRMAEKNLNSVIATVSWELIEPEEGKFPRN